LPTHAKSEVEKDAQIRLAFSNGVFKTSKKEFLEKLEFSEPDFDLI